MTRFPKTLADLAVSTNPTPLGVLIEARNLASHSPWSDDGKPLADVFSAALAKAESGALMYVDFECPNCGEGCDGHQDMWTDEDGCGDPIHECPCLLGVILKIALDLVNAEQDRQDAAEVLATIAETAVA